MILTFLTLVTFSQSHRLVTIHGQITDISTGNPVPYANIINPRIHGGTSSDGGGKFTLPIQVKDSIVITVLGYNRQVFHLNRSFVTDTSIVIELKPTSYNLKEVAVSKPKSIDFGFHADITKTPMQLRSDDYNKKPSILAALLNPLSFAHYNLSQKERNKRRAININQEFANWDRLKEVYNDSTIKKLTGIKEEKLDDFKLYCNPYFEPDTLYPRSEIYRRILIAYKGFIDQEKAQNSDNSESTKKP